MTDIAGLQRALDLYSSAVYWSIHNNESPNNQADCKAAQDLATALRERAVNAGVNTEQLTDAEKYARDCVTKGRKPLMAGWSFAHFRSESTPA